MDQTLHGNVNLRDQFNNRLDVVARQLRHAEYDAAEVRASMKKAIHVTSNHQAYRDMHDDHYVIDPIRAVRDEYANLVVIATVNVDAFTQPAELYEFTTMVLNAGADGVQAVIADDETPDWQLLAAVKMAADEAGKIFTMHARSIKCGNCFTIK
jgi:hypothetical protein